MYRPESAVFWHSALAPWWLAFGVITLAVVMSLRGKVAVTQLWALVLPPDAVGRWSAASCAANEEAGIFSRPSSS